MTKTIICPECGGRGTVDKHEIREDTGTNMAICTTTEEICHRCHGTGSVEVPMTNGDRIRAMSDRELAHFLAEYAVSGSNLRLVDAGYQPTATELAVLHEQLATTWMRWLRQYAEDD